MSIQDLINILESSSDKDEDVLINIFYHYTAKQFIEGIKKYGLTMGKTPIYDKGKLTFISNTQWITKCGDPDKQLWAIPVTIKYSRREYRLKINIPKPFMKNIISMETFMKKYKKLLPDGFNNFPEETKNWFIYNGHIPNKWIEQIRRTEY